MEMMQLPLLWAMLCAFTGAFMLYLLSFKNNGLRKIAKAAAYIGAACNLALVVVRGILVKGVPLNNGLEFAMCFTAAILLIFIVLEGKWQLSAVGVFVMPILVALTAWMINLDMTIAPLMPALRSYWLVFHVSSAVIAYGALALSCALSVAYLCKDGGRWDKENHFLPKLEVLDDLSYKMILTGLPFLTIMLITGAVWAEYAWGSFWSWDPKETWALITWLVYALYLHIRLMQGWRGRRTAWLSVIGFLTVIFTFIGVSYLLPGLHSYLG